MLKNKVALLQFLNENAEFDAFTLALLEENVFQDHNFSEETTHVLVEQGEIVAFGMGLIRPETQKGYVKFLVVKKTHRKKGLGSHLLQKIEAQLFEKGAICIRIAEANPNYFMPGVDVRYTAGHVFLEKRGYMKIGETYNLWVDLNVEDWDTTKEETQLLADKNIQIRRATIDDFEPMMAFCKAHFAGWQAEVENMFKNNPISLHVGIRKGQILGFAGHFGNNLGTGWFGPMGTDPNERKLGMGSVLYRRCLKDIKDAGYKGAIIPWVGPYPFYNKYSGAYIDRVFWRYERLQQA